MFETSVVNCICFPFQWEPTFTEKNPPGMTFLEQLPTAWSVVKEKNLLPSAAFGEEPRRVEGSKHREPVQSVS